RYLGAAGVGTLRLVGGAHDGAGLLGKASPSLTQSNPDVIVQHADWPADGAAWLAALDGVDLIVRSGFDCAWTEPGFARCSPPREGAGTLPGFPQTIAWTEPGFARRSPSREGAGTLPGFPQT